MIKIKRLVVFQNVSMVLGIVAFVISVFSLVSISRINDKIDSLNFDSKKDFTMIKDVPDVEVINNDGSVTKVHAKKSEDELAKLLETKQEKRSNENKRNSNNLHKKQNSSGKSSEKKSTASQPVTKNSEKITPISRAENKNNQQQVNKNKGTSNRISSNFIVQIGAFKDRKAAEQQCQNVQGNIDGKQCGIIAVNGQAFRAVIYPFTTNDSAVVFANKLSNKLNITCIAKKNV